MDSLLTASASEMARRIRAGSLTSEQAVEAHIAAIEQTHPAINAVVARRFDQARLEARAADKDKSDAPFHGVPCTIKEAFMVEGMPNTAGLVSRRGMPSPQDATTVARLRAAGFIFLGVTNISELCMWMESNNEVYGRTLNPYDPTRVAGGSSGGEGAVVGAGASPIGLGADIGGSIRLPAFFCGAFGHKPTGGLVPGTGQFPIAENAALRFLSTGPIARCAEDLFPFLEIVAGPDGEDHMCREYKLGNPDDVTLKGMEVLDVRSNGRSPVSQELLDVQERVAEYLASHGARVGGARIPFFKNSFAIWSSMMNAAADTSFSELLGEGVPINAGREMLHWAAGRSRHTFAAIGLALIEKVPLLSGDQAQAEADKGPARQAELEARIGDGVMLFPVYTSVAPKHHAPLSRIWHCGYTAIINAMELPSTTVPLGLNDEGLPLGVQIVARRGNDHLTIAVARELERGFGGWVPPPRLWSR